MAFLITTTIVALVKNETGSTISLPAAQCWNRIRRFFRKLLPVHGRAPRKFHSNSSSVVKNYLGDERLSETTLLESEEDYLQRPEQLNRKHSVNFANADHAAVPFVSLHQTIEVTEEAVIEEVEPELSLMDTYRVMFETLQLKPILEYIGMLFLVRVSFREM